MVTDGAFSPSAWTFPRRSRTLKAARLGFTHDQAGSTSFSMKRLPFLLISLLALFALGGGCDALPTDPPAEKPTNPSSTDPHAGHAMPTPQPSAGTAVDAGDRLRLDGADSLSPGDVTFRFTLFGTNGRPLAEDGLSIVHDKRVHLLLVRDDLSQFQHLHPEFRSGKWIAQTSITEPGMYQLYADISPIGEPPVVLRLPVRIGTGSSDPAFPTPNPFLEATAQGIRANLAPNPAFQAGTSTELTFRLTKDGAPLTRIDPYLSAFGHVVILKHDDPTQFLHVHPLTTAAPANGEVRFGTTFPSAGRYTLFAQFNAEGTVRTFPITVDVAAGQPTAETGMEGHAHH